MLQNQLAVVVGFLAALTFVLNQEVEPEYVTQYESKLAVRLIPADILRDHPERCFASTNCKTYDVNSSWYLSPYCGVSKCKVMEDPKSGRNFLTEEVQDCGPSPVVVPEPTGKVPPCKVDLTRFNATADFPGCCPVYVCAEGYSLEFPDLKANRGTKKDKKEGI